MYSVEDLLISHGYKLPKHSMAPPAPSSRQAPPPSPPSYSRHHEILENRPASRTANGYERGSRPTYGGGGGCRQPHAYMGGASCPNNNNMEPRDRSQSRQEGDSLTSDSGFCEGSRGGQQSQSKDVSYWRRRGQDFSVLLDYADFRECQAGGQGSYSRPEGPQQARGQELSADENQRAIQERQRWAAQAQVQAQAQAQIRSREREAALSQWRTATERKCQSLGTDEWRPAVSFGRQLSHNEGERWPQEQRRLHARTPEEMVVHPRTKAKSQSLPRMLQPDSLHYVDITSSGLEVYRRASGHPLSHHNLYRAPRWPENGRPASATQLSVTPKPRFTRPPRPPSYEMHQQIRGSCEVLSGRESVIPQARDRTPLPISRTGDSQLDYFAQDSGPPGYIPPPSYKRVPMMVGVRRGYGEIAVDYRYRGDVYQQIQVAPDGSHWFTRHPSGSWPDPQRERSIPCQKQLYPVYTTQERPGGGIQYIPFDDPRIRHISSALGGNSLTDADKIRHIRNELPSVTVSEPAADDSAFLPPPLGPFISAQLADDANQTSSNDFDNDNNRWHSNLHKETVDNFPATDQNYNNRYSKNQRPPPSPSSAFQAPLARTLSRQGSSSDQVFAETITQVKKIAPESGLENNRNTKRRVSETIFCLVSVPVHTPAHIHKDSADQNNNETMPSLSVTNTDTFAVGLKETHSLRSQSVNEMPIRAHYSHFHTSSTSSMRNYKRAPLRKEIIDAWALQASEDKELCYAGSWPGNQYRNQETQTGSPLTVVKSPEPQSPPGRQEPVPSATIDSSVAADSRSSYGYPMAGQKNLHPSSNSAFSRLSLSPTQMPSLQALQQEPTSPSTDRDQGDQGDQRDQTLSSARKSSSSPPESAGQMAFGQFLLKPVSRRPCDAIGELESINKEMEDTISKRPGLGPCMDGLEEANKKVNWLHSGARLSVCPEPGREAISLPPMHIEKPNIKVRAKSFASAADLESIDVRGGFPRNQAGVIPSLGLTPCPLPCSHSDSTRFYRQDIPVPQESLLRDVGLTVYTETPGGPGEPMQRSLSVPSPLSLKDLSHSLPLGRTWENGTVSTKHGASPEHNCNPVPEEETEGDDRTDSGTHLRGDVNLSQCQTRRESSSRSPKKDASPHVTTLTKEVSFVFEDGNGNDKSEPELSEPLTYKNESTIADEHLENLLIQEKANTRPVEDLSNLYEVKCAKGIPENESIEERAARILGIAVPVEALGVAEKQSEELRDDAEMPSPNEGTQQVLGEYEEVKEGSPVDQRVETEEVKLTELDVDHTKGDRQKHNNDGSDDTDAQPAAALELPEFPPSKLLLSLPLTTDGELARSMCSAEQTDTIIDSRQDKPSSSASSSATSPSRSSTQRTARLRLKSQECERDDCEPREGGNEETQPGDEDEENTRAEQDGQNEEDASEGPKNAAKPIDEMDDLQEDSKEDKDLCKREDVQGEGGATNDVKAPQEEQEGRRGDVDLKTGETERGEKTEKLLENEKDGQTAAGGSQTRETRATNGDAKDKIPKAKRRTKLQKPPLLPKPRSVPKREITLPLSFSAANCSPTKTEEEKVTDSYDPSRVERV